MKCLNCDNYIDSYMDRDYSGDYKCPNCGTKQNQYKEWLKDNSPEDKINKVMELLTGIDARLEVIERIVRRNEQNE